MQATGNCFYTAAQRLVTDVSFAHWTLKHGTAMGLVGEAEGIRYPHAWLECGAFVWCPNLHERGVEAKIHRDVYYSLGNLTVTESYSKVDARAELAANEHWGPWDAGLIELGRSLGIESFGKDEEE